MVEKLHQRLLSYYNSEPEQIIYWQDKYIKGAKGWIVIDKLINGVAGGGLFIDKNASVSEVRDLAKTMTYKNALQNLLFGGAKAGIKFDPASPQANLVLQNFLYDNRKIIAEKWCTGADLNTSNQNIFSIVKNYLALSSPFVALANMIAHKLNIAPNNDLFEQCLNYQINSYFTLGDSITGHMLARIVKLKTTTDRLTRPKVILQGFGKVGKSFAYYLQQENIATIVAIIEQEWAIYNNDGIDIIEVLDATARGSVTTNSSLSKQLIKKGQLSDEGFLIHILKNTTANIFSPCACRYTINDNVFTALIQCSFALNRPGHSYIISGANNAFYDKMILARALKSQIKIVPEWLSNSGNALLFMEALQQLKYTHIHGQTIVEKIWQTILSHYNNILLSKRPAELTFYEKSYEYIINRVKNN